MYRRKTCRRRFRGDRVNDGKAGGPALLPFGGAKPPLGQALEGDRGNPPGVHNHVRGPD
jgi:hypothetical protein